MQKGAAQPVLIILVIVVALAGLYFFTQRKPSAQKTETPATSQTPAPKTENANLGQGSAKGVVIVQNPKPKQVITSPLTVSGVVYGNNGTLTIKLKQKESGEYVTEDKVAKISGKADKISFAEALQFGLPVQPQTGVLEVSFKDGSGQGLDDKAEIEVEFPSDLGKGD